MKRFTFGVQLFLLGLSLPFCSWCSTIHGQVSGNGGKTPIPGAHVKLIWAGHQELSNTDADGRYEFSGLEPGVAYTLVVDAEGLHSSVQRSILLGRDETRLFDLVLMLADVRSTVKVQAGLVRLSPSNTEISQSIDATEIAELPRVSRSAAKFALLDPHVLQPIALGADYQDANRLSINGASYRHTSYLLDGVTNYDWVYANNPQATVAAASVSSVKVLAGDYSAQYGNSTAGVIAITTGEGTSQHHGDLFSYIRPSGIQASPALARFHIPNQKLDWGASAGGPVSTDRTRYFASYERTEEVRGAVITSPTPGFYNGQSDDYAALARVDRELTSAHALAVRMNGDHYATDNANDRIAGINNPSYGRTARIQSWGGQTSERSTFGNKVNEFSFTYTNYVPDSATPLNASVGVVVPNYLQAGYSTYSWVHAQSETAGDLFLARFGRHEMKAGGEVEHLHVRDYSYTPDGTYYYNSATEYLSNHPYQYLQTYGAADVRYGQVALNAFVQNDFQLARRLTGSVGLRYEFQSITNSLHNVGPRLGLAWDVTGSGKTVAHLGAGAFFDQYYMYLNRRFITLGPHSPQYNEKWDCTATPNPCPVYPNIVSSPSQGVQSPTVAYLYIPADQLLNPYSLQVSASLEHEIAPNTVLTVSGLQIHTLQQMRVNDINHPAPFDRTAPGQMRSVAAANATRPYTVYDGVHGVTLIDRIENTASSIFQAFDASVKSRLGDFGEVNVHYVLSGSYSYAMFYADYNSGVPNEWWPGWDKYERAPSDFYQRHHVIADSVLHGPRLTLLSLVGNFGSGLPVNPVTGVDNNGDGYTVDRPLGHGRNSFRTPPLRTLDASMAKQFSLRGDTRFELRVQALNALNSRNYVTVNNIFGNGATALSTFLSAQAGIGNTNPSRQLELVGRFIF